MQPRQNNTFQILYEMRRIELIGPPRFFAVARTLEAVVNSLECGGPAPLWSAATGRRIVESTQAGVAATRRDRPKRCQASALQRVVAAT